MASFISVNRKTKRETLRAKELDKGPSIAMVLIFLHYLDILRKVETDLVVGMVAI